MSSKITAVQPQPSPDTSALKRRSLFAGAGTVGALAATAAVLPRLVQPAVQVAAPARPLDADGGYQLTDHVARYYQTARV